MKKKITTIILIVIMMLAFASVTFASSNTYKLSNLSVTTASVSVDVKNESDTEENARVYIALYDEHNMLLGVQSEPVELVVGGSTTVTKEFYANSATTVKAFVVKDVFVPCSRHIYKTTLSDGNIEFGGDV